MMARKPLAEDDGYGEYVHGDWIWSIQRTGRHRYGVYRVGVSIGRRVFVDSYRFRFLAERRCRKGNP